jgi:ADP-ribose pyrophosphatase
MTDAADTAPRVLYRGRWLNLLARDGWEYAERVQPAGAVIIVALTPEDRVLLVEQFRVPIQKTTIEMPAGLIGDIAGQDDEGALVAARRELEEETGYACEHVSYLHAGPASAGMSTEMMTFVRAHGLRRVGAGGGDDSEDITVHEVPRAEAGAWLLRKAAEGYSIDPKIFAGLWYIEHADQVERARQASA